MIDNLLKQRLAKLAQHLKVKFGLAPNSPSDEEIKNILNDISNIEVSERTEVKWREIVYKNVKSAGKYRYYGLDNSDLNVLYEQIVQYLDKDDN